MSMISCDYLIIGGGKAGLYTANLLVKNQKQVVLVGADKIGGSNEMYQEIPKMFFLQEIKNLKNLSAYLTADKNSVQKLTKLKNLIPQKVRDKSNKHAQFISLQIQKNPHINMVFGIANFVSPTTVSVKFQNKTQLFRPKNIILTVGKSDVSCQTIPGLEITQVKTKYTIWNIEQIPDTLAIIGLDKEALEVAIAFSQIGVSVSVYLSQTLQSSLGMFDKTVCDYITKTLNSANVEIWENSKIIKLKHHKDHADVYEAEQDAKFFDTIYITTNDDFCNSISVENANVKYNVNGIKTSYFGQTNQKHIYAFGSCNSSQSSLETVGKFLDYYDKKAKLSRFSPSSQIIIRSVQTVGETIRKTGQTQTYSQNYIRNIRSFCTCGMTEDDATGKFGKYADSKIFAGKTVQGMVKIVFHTSSKKILGYSLIGDCLDIFDCFMKYALDHKLKYSEVISTLTQYINLGMIR
jgi:pyruvate/2-oxoglutarate dehydrogenase complex dihydrolipoamide dehydrogenase (E3) component